MPRGSKCRRVCAEPGCRQFSPDHCEGAPVLMTVEELETIRLCDLEGLDQEGAALRMNISRGTLQRMLYSARKRMAEALVLGKRLIIEGGHYEIADRGCGQQDCCHCRFEKEETKENE